MSSFEDRNFGGHAFGGALALSSIIMSAGMTVSNAASEIANHHAAQQWSDAFDKMEAKADFWRGRARGLEDELDRCREELVLLRCRLS